MWRKCRVGRVVDKGESLWQVGQLETRTREEKMREVPARKGNQARQSLGSELVCGPVRRLRLYSCEDGGRAKVIHTHP